MLDVEDGVSRRRFLQALLLAPFSPLLEEVQGLPNPIELAEADWRDRIRKKTIKVEEGGVFGAGNNLLLYKIGGPRGISFTEGETHILSGQTWTHVHLQYPDGFLGIPPLDTDDMYLGWYFGLREIRAVGVNPETGKNYLCWANQGNRVYWPSVPRKNIDEQIKSEFLKIRTGTLLARAIEAYEKVWTDWAEKTGAFFKYEEW